MGTVLDTSVLVAAERGMLDLEDLLARYPGDPHFLAAITVSELIHGLLRAKLPDHRKRRQAFIDATLSRFAVLPFDLEVAQVHARVWAELSSAGITIGPHDLIVAATALAIDARVATRDMRSFPKIPGLEILRW